MFCSLLVDAEFDAVQKTKLNFLQVHLSSLKLGFHAVLANSSVEVLMIYTAKILQPRCFLAYMWFIKCSSVFASMYRLQTKHVYQTSAFHVDRSQKIVDDDILSNPPHESSKWERDSEKIYLSSSYSSHLRRSFFQLL